MAGGEGGAVAEEFMFEIAGEIEHRLAVDQIARFVADLPGPPDVGFAVRAVRRGLADLRHGGFVSPRREIAGLPIHDEGKSYSGGRRVTSRKCKLVRAWRALWLKLAIAAAALQAGMACEKEAGVISAAGKISLHWRRVWKTFYTRG